VWWSACAICASWAFWASVACAACEAMLERPFFTISSVFLACSLTRLMSVPFLSIS
jgi:hypothetical protein